MVPIADRMDANKDNNQTAWIATETTTENNTVGESTPFDTSVLGEILAALDYYYIPVVIAVGLIGNGSSLVL